MKIHHISCGSFCVSLAPLVRINLAEYCCHCLLIETKNDGLILIDSGFSSKDVYDPLKRLGLSTLLMTAKISEETTALYQIAKMGFEAADLRHIVLTHMDPDHMGGIADFPHATVHIFKDEFYQTL